MEAEIINVKANVINNILAAVAAEDSSIDIAFLRSRLYLELDDYDISVREKGLVPYTEGKNEFYIKRFILSKIAAGCTETTVRRYTGDLSRFLETLGKDADTITSDEIQIYLARIMQRASKITAQNTRRALSSFYTWMQREEYVQRNPMNRVDSIRCVKQQKKAFEDIEVERIRLACKTWREKALVEMLLSTGCRISEVAQMKTADINGDSIEVFGKGQKYRTVYLNAKALVSIENYLAERKDNNPYIFPKSLSISESTADRKGKKRANYREWYRDPRLIADGHMDKSSLESIIRTLGKRAKVEDCHPHRFRRTCATNALSAGMPIEMVSMMLGHASIATTQIYLDISGEDLAVMHRKYVK